MRTILLINLPPGIFNQVMDRTSGCENAKPDIFRIRKIEICRIKTEYGKQITHELGRVVEVLW